MNIGSLIATLGVDTSGLGKARQDMNNFGKSAEKTFGGIGNSAVALAGAFGVAFSVKEMIEWGGEASKMAGIAEGVKNQFDKIATPGLLNDLIKATRGTADNLTLMQSAVNASNFKIPMEQLGTLLEFAQKRAIATGQSVDHLVESIVMGIGRKSPMILDNLGISAVELREKLAQVGGEAASIGDVARIVGDIAQRELSKMGNEALTSAEKSERLKASIKNIQSSLGEKINKGFLDDLKTEVTEVLDRFVLLTKGIANVTRTNSIDDLKKSIQGLSGEEMVNTLKKQGDQIKLFKDSKQEEVQYWEQQEGIMSRIQVFGKEFATNTNKQIKDAYEVSKGYNEALEWIDDILENTDMRLALEKEVNKITSDAAPVEQLSTYGQILKDIEATQEALKTVDDAHFETMKLKLLNLKEQQRLMEMTRPETMNTQINIEDSGVNWDLINDSIGEAKKNLFEFNDSLNDTQAVAAVQVWNNLATEMAMIETQTKYAGEAFDEGAAQIYAYENALMSLIELGLRPGQVEVDLLIQNIKALKVAQDANAASFDHWGNMIGEIAVEAAHMFGVLVSGTQSAQSALYNFVAMALQLIQKVINQLLAEAIAGMIAKSVKDKGILGLVIAAAGIAGLMALWGSTVKPEKMAGGGEVPPGYPNDTYPAMLSSGETVTPARHARNAARKEQLVAVVRGQDLLFILTEAENKNKKYF